MGYDFIEDYCLAKKGVLKDYKTEWEATRYFIGGKMFAMQGNDKEGNPIFTIKLEPSYGNFLRNQYKDNIVPGYYMNKEHWNSLYLDGTVPNDIVYDIIDKSYFVVFNQLTKKLQKEIEES